MNILEEAILFATNAHQGQQRKSFRIPYILHPMEVASIIATVTDDVEIMAAGMLHDTVEDCGIPLSEIGERFGERVRKLVEGETEDKMPGIDPSESWVKRKEDSLRILVESNDPGLKILWLGDKLSNMRAFWRGYREQGDSFWHVFHQQDTKLQAWYYRTIAEDLSELSHTDAYKEYVDLINNLFGEE